MMNPQDTLDVQSVRTQSLTDGMRRGSIWYDDGSVVLQVQQTQFRVHRSLLCQYSEIFRDMFHASQPDPDEELVEGCPVVELQDKADDWHYVLTALFISPPSRDEAIPIGVVSAYLRLGKKYDIKKITADAMDRLIYEYPTTLQAYQSLTPGSRIQMHGLDTHFDAFNLIKEMGITSLLPTILYRCSGLLPEILKGAKRDDGSLAILESDDQLLCVEVFQMLCQLHVNVTLKWIDLDVRCRNVDCLDQRLSLVVAHLGENQKVFQFSETWPGDDRTAKLCQPRCRDNAKRRFEQGQLEAWEALLGILEN